MVEVADLVQVVQVVDGVHSQRQVNVAVGVAPVVLAVAGKINRAIHHARLEPMSFDASNGVVPNLYLLPVVLRRLAVLLDDLNVLAAIRILPSGVGRHIGIHGCGGLRGCCWNWCGGVSWNGSMCRSWGYMGNTGCNNQAERH